MQKLLGDVWVALAALDHIVDETEQDDYIDRQEVIGREALTRIESQLVALAHERDHARRAFQDCRKAFDILAGHGL